MEKVKKPFLIIILGPTASGKSDLAVMLAKKINGEIISADSRQVYKGLDIGTGKITKKEMRGIPHYCLDIATPKKQISVADYQACAKRAIQKIIAKRKIPILVGGSGMYIDAVLYGAPYPKVPPNKKLRARLEKKTTDVLFGVLQKKDPLRANTIDRHNKRRLIRALEIIEATKKPVPPLKKIPIYNALFIGIARSRRELSRRIDIRFAKRMRHGMIGEVRRLRARGISHARLHELGLEYRFLSDHLTGALSKKELSQKLLRAIKQYAKRQETWFRQYPQTRWVRNKKEACRYIRTHLKNNSKPRV